MKGVESHEEAGGFRPLSTALAPSQDGVAVSPFYVYFFFRAGHAATLLWLDDLCLSHDRDRTRDAFRMQANTQILVSH